MNVANNRDSGEILTGRIIEAYVGEYASGKSETAVNRALELQKLGRKVTLVDLDLVEPCYTLRPLKKSLEAQGIEVVAWETKQLIGLGETGMVLHPGVPWVLRRSGDIVLDVGYGVGGARTLNLVEEIYAHPELRVFAVINIARPLTSTVNDIVEYVNDLGLVHALINNANLGTDTDLKVIQQGVQVVTEAAQELGLPIEATIVEEKWREIIGPVDVQGNPVRFIRRRMTESFW